MTPKDEAACHFREDARTGQPVASFFIHIRAHLSTIDPLSDHEQANTLHPIREKSLRALCLAVVGLAFLSLGACERATEGDAKLQALDVAEEPSCGDAGRLSTQLYGGIAKQISWAAGELRCESMMRPDGKGVRLRFTGNAVGNQLAIILALPELRRGFTGKESPTVVTLTVEGSGRFFSTPTLESCWSDITTQDPVDGGNDRFDISGTLYCVAPLGEINGETAISIPELEFRGIVDWSAT